MKLTLAVLMFCLLACGGGNGNPVLLNPALGKTWVGTTVTSFAGNNPFSSATPFTIVVNANTAHSTDVCPPNGGGTIDATGSGNTASWSGSMACPPIPQTGKNCSITLTLTNATMTLSADGSRLDVSGGGTVTGCNQRPTFNLYFIGN